MQTRRLADDAPRLDLVSSDRTLADRAYGQLHRAIVTGALEPGKRLRVDNLAERLKMSPMPVREAVRRLASEGLVENVPHRGARVAALSIDDLKMVFDARLALEPLAVARAAQRFTDADAAAAEEALERHKRFIAQQALSDVWVANTDFHMGLYRSAGSRWLMRLITPLWQSSARYRHAAGLLESDLADRAVEHRGILAACIAHDDDCAARRLYNHLAVTANSISLRLDGPELFSPLRRGEQHTNPLVRQSRAAPRVGQRSKQRSPG